MLTSQQCVDEALRAGCHTRLLFVTPAQARKFNELFVSLDEMNECNLRSAYNLLGRTVAQNNLDGV